MTGTIVLLHILISQVIVGWYSSTTVSCLLFIVWNRNTHQYASQDPCKAHNASRTKWPPRHIETLFSPIPLHRTACIGASRMNKIIKNWDMSPCVSQVRGLDLQLFVIGCWSVWFHISLLPYSNVDEVFAMFPSQYSHIFSYMAIVCNIPVCMGCLQFWVFNFGCLILTDEYKTWRVVARDCPGDIPIKCHWPIHINHWQKQTYPLQWWVSGFLLHNPHQQKIWTTSNRTWIVITHNIWYTYGPASLPRPLFLQRKLKGGFL